MEMINNLSEFYNNHTNDFMNVFGKLAYEVLKIEFEFIIENDGDSFKVHYTSIEAKEESVVLEPMCVGVQMSSEKSSITFRFPFSVEKFESALDALIVT